MSSYQNARTNILLPWAGALVAIVLVVGMSGIIYPTATFGKAYAAASTTTTTEKIPINTTFLPVGPGCEEAEPITLSGTLNVVVHETVKPNGGVTFKIQFNPQGVTGIGETTGTKYQGTGVTTTIVTFNSQNSQETETFVNNFNIIATKPAGISSIEHLVTHVTVNAQGEITADVFTQESSCR
jgi:hypothetical protein